MQRPILHNFWRSSCSYRIRIVLNWKQIPYEYRLVERPALRSQEFLAINPAGKVPVLEIDGQVLFESTAILEYLEETRPARPLIHPTDPHLRYQARSVAQLINSGIQPLQNVNWLGRMQKKHPTIEPIPTAAENIRNGFRVLEEILPERGGYFVGNEATIAEVLLMPQIFNARKFEVNIQKEFPKLYELEGRLLKIEAFEKAHPCNMTDAPEEDVKRYKEEGR